MRWEIVFWYSCFVFGASRALKFVPNPDVNLSVVEIIRKYEYPVEYHEIETPDGYLLTLFRIPHGRNSIPTHSKPVLLVHGLFGQASNFIASGQINQSLAYHLADRGYDVWMANARGTTYSRKHKTLNPDKDKEFWSFCWDEIGSIDLPTKIDYILAKTGHESLYYIGHSQGCTTYFVMLSARPEYNAKIKAAVMLAPAVIFKHINIPIYLYLSQQLHLLTRLAELINLYELPPFLEQIQTILPVFCAEQTILKGICKTIYKAFVGDASQMESDLLPLLISKISPASARQALHYGQCVLTGRFQPYNFGKKGNRLKYGQDYPSDYNITEVTAPTAIFYSKEDLMVTYQDAMDLCKKLPTLIKCHLVQKRFNHMDYLVGKEADKLVYSYIFKIFDKY